MSVTVQSIFDQVCYDLLENSVAGPGMITGITSQQQVLDYLGQVVLDFLRQTGIVQDVFTQQLVSGTSRYTIPTLMSEPYYGFIDSRIIERVDTFSDYLMGGWRNKTGYPKAWHQDGLPLKTVEVVPAPNWSGSATVLPAGDFGSFSPGARNLSIVGSILPTKETWLIGETLDTIPDTFTPYLSFGILHRIFSHDGEAKENQRAMYCQSRYLEGVNLAKSILWQLMEDAEAE